MSKKSPIGILDSGFGGLSVLKEIVKMLPAEEIIYVGDSAWCPYGEKSAQKIYERVEKITDWLLEKNCKIITLACNSATIAAIEALRAHYPIHFVGMEPAVKPAVQMTKTGIIGVLATSASIAGEKFHKLLINHAKSVKVITRPCPEFVQIVENGEMKTRETRFCVEKIVRPLVESGADVLVLGCTHYPFLREIIQEVAGENIQVIDSGMAVARRVRSVLDEDELLVESSGKRSKLDLYTTGNFTLWEKIVPMLCPELDFCIKELELD